MRVCDFCTHTVWSQHHDSSVHWQILGDAPVHQNDLFYSCSFIVNSKWLLSNSSRGLSIWLSRIQFGGSTLGLWSPSTLCPALFLVAMSSNELLQPSRWTGAQPAHEIRLSSCGPTTLTHGQITRLLFSLFCDAMILMIFFKKVGIGSTMAFWGKESLKVG